MKSAHRSWIEIDTKALTRNFQQFKKVLAHSTRSTRSGRLPLLMAIVKSNAYGHGMVECAKAFNKAGANFFGVDDIDEALVLRKAEIKKPILVLGYTLPSRYAEASKKNISITVSSLEQMRRFKIHDSRFKNKLKIHLKIDTGLHRQGISFKEIDKANRLIRANGRIILEGVHSHFASAENPDKKGDVDFTKGQIEKFKNVINQVKAFGFNPIAHIAGTAATLLYPESHFGMVRIGIGLYGLCPSKAMANVLKNISLKPAMSWKTIISEVKKVKKGERVGYDLTEKLARDSVLAVIPVGYWHGYPRSLSSKGEVLVRGKRAKIVGRICMDMCIIDVTGIMGAHEGDEVVIIGKQGKEEITAEELSAQTETINYEIVTRINPLLQRKFS